MRRSVVVVAVAMAVLVAACSDGGSSGDGASGDGAGADGPIAASSVLRQAPAAQDCGEGLDQRLDGAGRGFDRQGLCSGWFGKDVTPQML